MVLFGIMIQMFDCFDYFVVFVEMWMGLNFLEVNLNVFEGVKCYGEVFNLYFIVYLNYIEFLGFDQVVWDVDFFVLLNVVCNDLEYFVGFWFFNDYDFWVLDEILNDLCCGKIILMCNLLDSFVSWKIVQVIGQWKLMDVCKWCDSKVQFDGGEFVYYVVQLQVFQVQLMNGF